MSDIFYSQVNRKVAQELDLRGDAGKTGRSNDQLNYMLSKIANVELTAYKGFIQDDEILGVLGGRNTRSTSFLPSGPDGYLNRFSKRPEPVITGVTVNIADNAQYAINTSTVTILIQDPVDLDIIENIYFKPGRVVKLAVRYPETAILSEDPNLSQSELVTSTRILRKEFAPELVDEFLKMDRLIFTGLVNSFSIKYNEDVTITATLNLRATAGTYPDAEMFITNTDIPSSPVDTDLSKKNFYTLLNEDINNTIKENSTTSGAESNPIEILIPKSIEIDEQSTNLEDRSILNGAMYTSNTKTTNTSIKPKMPENRFITLGLLIDKLDKFIGTQIKNNSTTIGSAAQANELLFCNDKLCFSNYYEHLVSADPNRILLWPGNNNHNTNIYKTAPDSTIGKVVYNGIKPVTPGYYSEERFVKLDTAGEEIPSTEQIGPVGHPSRIYISIDVIKDIVMRLTAEATKLKPFTLKAFLQEISFEIGKQTGYAVSMALIQHPDIPDALLYYDTNYLGLNQQIPEYEIPVFASKGKGSVIREFKLGFDLPNAYKTTLFGFGSTQASPTALTSFNPWLFSNSTEAQEKAAEDFQENHKKNLTQLNQSKEFLGLSIYDTERINSLQQALAGYIAYPTKQITEASKNNKPIWPMDLEFTIDGINGFIYGDVLYFRGLPSRYNQQFVFCINRIKHTISDSGEWTTTITCWARTRILEAT
jgi:hypothetical protein